VSLIAGEKPPSEKWENAIQAFETADRKNPPPAGAVLFTGAPNIVVIRDARRLEWMVKGTPGPVNRRGTIFTTSPLGC